MDERNPMIDPLPLTDEQKTCLRARHDSLTSERANLLRQAITNDMYAAACERTAAETGRESAARQAEQHRIAAAEKRARANRNWFGAMLTRVD
jgi:hypothetical protein